MRDNMGEWGVVEELFLSCPPGIESLATPLVSGLLCVSKTHLFEVDILNTQISHTWLMLLKLQQLQTVSDQANYVGSRDLKIGS